MSTDFKSLMEWKEEQAGIDLVDIRRSQDSIKEAIDTVQRDMFEKIAREEVSNNCYPILTLMHYLTQSSRSSLRRSTPS